MSVGYQLVPLENLKPGTRFRISHICYKDDVYTLAQLTEEQSLPIIHDDGNSWAHGTRLYLGRSTLVEPCEDK